MVCKEITHMVHFGTGRPVDLANNVFTSSTGKVMVGAAKIVLPRGSMQDRINLNTIDLPYKHH